MKVTVERNALLKTLGHVHRVVERRNTYPILANVLLKAADGKIDLRATDLDIEVTESVPAMVATAPIPPSEKKVLQAESRTALAMARACPNW